MVITRNTSTLTTNQGNGATIDSESDVNALFESLPEDHKTLVKVITEIITTNLNDKLTDIQKEIAEKDKQIHLLKNDITTLKCRVDDLELHLDNVDQYERRDTVILSGASLPPETTQENTTNVTTQVIKDQLKINIKESDISVSHRLGPKRQQVNRPIIVKLVNRSLKRDLVGACIQLRPQLYVNESLTPKRRGLLNKILTIRKAHTQKFQQCYTQDGRITIKLRNSTIKHTIIDEKQFITFLEKYPEMMDTYLQSALST
ncbi:hypothetical protein GWK47_003543 [Chionoecetes opilio]|uniref:Uncharacterized protein n=1 Tax=Chionoecetes opilio TaxID=41210 RepID=A0A8J4YLD0_CHIOP|nr:hypothetical protein GWK47_003543 [Chionoecetes opilio]